jgi:hypothetical protein
VWTVAIGSMMQPFPICADGDTYARGEIRDTTFNAVSASIRSSMFSRKVGFPTATAMLG